MAARFSAEAGLFFITPMWQPAAVMVGLLGSVALGPKGLIIIGLMMMLFANEPREILMPFVANALKIGQNAGIRPGRIGGSAVAVYVMALAVAIPTTLWASYKLGAGSAKRYEAENKTWSKLTFNATEKAMTEMTNHGELQQSIGLKAWHRLTHMRPNKCVPLLRRGEAWPWCWSSACCGCGTPGGRSTHHVLRLGHAVDEGPRASRSCWAGSSRATLSRLGLLTGGRIGRVKALMVGMIAGDLLAGVIFMIAGAIYYADHGPDPARILHLPALTADPPQHRRRLDSPAALQDDLEVVAEALDLPVLEVQDVPQRLADGGDVLLDVAALLHLRGHADASADVHAELPAAVLQGQAHLLAGSPGRRRWPPWTRW